MSEHPIENLMNTAMNSIKDMIDVDTIIGEPIETSNNVVIIPISKVGFGFASGGSEFRGETINEYTKKDKEEQVQYRLPFGGGSGAGVSISPIAFLVISQSNVKLLPVDHNSCIDRLLDYVPDLMDKLNTMLNKQMQIKKEEKQKEDKKIESKMKEEKKKKEQQEVQNQDEEIISNGQIVKPKRNIKPKNPMETYEFEYDETENEFFQDEDN